MTSATHTLMERENAGLKVELRCDLGAFSPDGVEVTIVVTDGEDEPMTAVVPSDRAMDAFHHPFVYLHRAA